MFRKIRSNRDPADTLWSELKRELSPYFKNAGPALKHFAENHPRLIFRMMIAAIIVSAAFSFTLFRQKAAAPERKPVKIGAPLTGGIGRILETGDAIRQMLTLKKQIDSLTAKKTLTASDSLALENALDRFRQLSWKFDSRKPVKH